MVISPLINTIVKKNSVSMTKDKICIKCNSIIGTLVNGKTEAVHFSFVREKPTGYEVFCKPETIQIKMNNSVLNTINF